MALYFPKTILLDFISIYYTLDSSDDSFSNYINVSKAVINYDNYLSEIEEYRILIQYINTHRNNPNEAIAIKYYFTELVNILLKHYKFINSTSVPFTIPTLEVKNDTRDTITVDIPGGDFENADLLVTEEELIEAANEYYQLDAFSYPRLFYEAKLERISRGEIECAVCGLSYTQHGIAEKLMPVPTVNLSVSGQDIPYSVLLAQKVINLSEKIKTIIIPVTYYMGFYDISSDDHPAHEGTVACVLAPLTNDKRHFEKDIYQDGYMKYPGKLEIYNYISDLTKYRDIRDSRIRKELEDKEFFNDMLAQSPTGGLKFDFKELKGDAKAASADITEGLNRRVATYSGLEEVIKSLREYSSFMKDKSIKTIFFVPPFTRALSEATDRNSMLRELFYKNVVPEINDIPNAFFTDLCDSSEFGDEDFVDFEHLDFYTGGKKLTNILGSLI